MQKHKVCSSRQSCAKLRYICVSVASQVTAEHATAAADSDSDTSTVSATSVTEGNTADNLREVIHMSSNVEVTF